MLQNNLNYIFYKEYYRGILNGKFEEKIKACNRIILNAKVSNCNRYSLNKQLYNTAIDLYVAYPGLLVGTGSKFEYFQSAYSGASTEEIVPVEITLASKTGAFSCFYRSDKDNLTLRKRMAELKKLGMSKTQLETISDVVCSVYRDNRDAINAPHIVFRTPLPTCITWDHTHHAVVEVDARKKVD